MNATATAVALLALLVGAFAQDKVPQPMPIAVVDVEEIVQHTKAAKKSKETLAVMMKDVNEKLKELENREEELKITLPTMKPSPQKAEQQAEFKALALKRQEMEKYLIANVRREQLKLENEMFAEAQQAVEDLAKRRGILLVLRKIKLRTTEDLVQDKHVRNEGEAIQLQSALNRERSVWYAAPPLDITEDVIKTLKAN